MLPWCKNLALLLSLSSLGWGALSHAASAEVPTTVAVAVEDGADGVRVLISPPRSNEMRVYVLGEPNRMVIDIAGVYSAPRRDLVPPENPLVSGVRFGRHPGKIRVVADIKTAEVPTPSLIDTMNGTAIVLPVSAEIRAAFTALQQDALRQATEEALAVSETAGPTLGVGQQLNALTFERTPSDGAPVVRLGLTERPAFSFQRADAKTYRLTLQNCSVGGSQLALPHYPPDDFIGFTIVEVRQNGSSTEVLIGVDHDFKIAPTTSENSIVIRSMPRG